MAALLSPLRRALHCNTPQSSKKSSSSSGGGGGAARATQPPVAATVPSSSSSSSPSGRGDRVSRMGTRSDAPATGAKVEPGQELGAAAPITIQFAKVARALQADYKCFGTDKETPQFQERYAVCARARCCLYAVLFCGVEGGSRIVDVALAWVALRRQLCAAIVCPTLLIAARAALRWRTSR